MQAAPTIAALPTPFDGIEYRSRLEARWAVLFRELGMPFSYEPEGYELPEMFVQTAPNSGTALLPAHYLPDFWLPQASAFLEIKPEPVTDPRHCQLAAVSRRTVYVTQGNFPRDLDDLAASTLIKWIPFAASPVSDSALILFPSASSGLLDLALRKASRYQFRL